MPDSPTNVVSSSGALTPIALPITSESTTKASHPKMAFFRCWALQRPIRAAKFLVSFTTRDTRPDAPVNPWSLLASAPPVRPRIGYG